MIAVNPAFLHGQIDQAFDIVAKAIAETMSCARVCLWRYDQAGRAFDALHLLSEGRRSDPAGLTVSADHHPRFFSALEQNQSVAAGDALSDRRTSELAADYLRACRVTSMIATPIRNDGRLAGMLSVEHTGPRHAWTSDERRFVSAMAECLGGTFESADREQRHADALKARAAAEAASQAKTDFLSSMSHELRTPLNAIIGFSEIMSEQAFGPLLPRYHEYVSDIHKSAAHLLNIINDVLDIARIESGKMTLYEGPVELPALVEESLAFVRERAAKKSVTLEAQVADDAASIRADDSRIRQIMLNLLSNAVKFTETGGRVWVTVGRGPDDRVAISVGDTGIGMSPEEIPRALEPFRQVDSMLARTQEGSGLGLPISKKLAALHGAAFEIDSAVGRGTVVTMVFPSERTLHARAMGSPSLVATS
ncbi:MAG: GAF domain-containing sensor histidine kinase [Alphaproteobacteria bacterium]